MHKKRRLTSAPALSILAILAIGGTMWTESELRQVDSSAEAFKIVSDDGAEFELSDNSALPNDLKAAVYRYISQSNGDAFTSSGLQGFAEYAQSGPETQKSVRIYLGRVLASKKRFDEAKLILSAFSAKERQRLGASFAFAETLKGLGETDAAGAAYYAHISQNPSHQAGHINYAILLSDLNRHQEAIEVLERAVEITSGDRKGKSYSLLGIAHMALGDHKAAESALEQSIRFRPGHGPTWRRLAIARAHLENFSQTEIISTFQRSDAVAPGNASTKQAFSNYYFSVGRFDDALPLYSDVSKIAPEKIQEIIQRAYNLIASERPSAARRLLKKIKTQRVSGLEKQQVKILDTVLNGSQAQALKLLEKLDSRATSGATKFGIILASLKVGDFDNAQSLAQDFDENSIFVGPSKFKIARGLHRAGRDADALALLEELVAKDSQSPIYWLYLSRVRSALKKPQDALRAAERAYALYPESGHIAIGYSEALSMVGVRARAAEILFTYLEMKPKDRRALSALADFYIAEDNFDRAEQLLKIVHELQADNSRVVKDLARVQLRADRAAVAIQTLGKIIAQKPADTEARLMRARALERLGDTKAAMSEYETILKLDAENEAAKTELHRIGG